MPSHQDRVRRNYHTVTGEIVDNNPQLCVDVHVRITKLQIATWMHPKSMARMVAQNVYDRVMAITKEGK